MFYLLYRTGHDTAGALIEEMPDSDEFLADLKVLKKYIDDIRKRRKENEQGKLLKSLIIVNGNIEVKIIKV